MGKPTIQNNSFINHFSHPHRLQLTPVSSSPPCSACKLAGGNGSIYTCRPCNFSLHDSCSKMNQVITHPSHPSHTLTLLVAPVYDGGYFNCDGCGVNGTGFSYQCSRCDFDIHALCAYKPISIVHKSHPQHNLKLTFYSPYGANKGFSCDICLQIGKNQWLYRCVLCEFDAHVGCITQPQPHLLQHSTSAPTPHIHHAGHPQHQGNSRPTSRPNGLNSNPNRPSRPISNLNRPNGVIDNRNRPIAPNAAAFGPRRQNNNLSYNVPVGPIEVIGQVGQSFGQESMDGSGYDGSAANEEFDGEVDVEVEYEGGDDGDDNVEEEDVDGNRLEVVAYGDDEGDACSESEFGGSSDARSQCNDLSDHADLYPLSVRTNQSSGSSAARSKKMGLNGPRGRLQGSKNPIQSPKGSQTRRVQNVRNNNQVGLSGSVRFNRLRDPTAFNGPQGFNGPSGGSSNAIDNGGNNDNYNEVDGTDMFGGEDNVGYGENYAVGDGDCDFQDEGDFAGDGYGQAYDETYGENDFESYSDITGGSESLYDGEEAYGTMDESQYIGLNDEPNNQYLPVLGPVGGPRINNQNIYDQSGRSRNMGRYGRGGTTNMNRYGNMNQNMNSSQNRTIGRTVQYRPNVGPSRVNGGLNGPNVVGNTMMNTMVQGLCQGFAMNMLGVGGGGGDVNGVGGDGGGSSILGGMFGGESDSQY